MAAVGEEDYLGRSGSGNQRKLRFVVTGTDSDAEAKAWVMANAPSSHDGLAFTDVGNIRQIADSRWAVDASYGSLTGVAAVIPEPEPSTASYSFLAQVEPETFYYSVDRQSVVPAGTPNLDNGPIGVQLVDGRGRHAGIDVPAGPITDEITYEYPNAVIPVSYRDTVRALIGGVNNATWLNSPAGTMRLVSVRASITATNKQTINYGFAYRPNRTNVNLGPLAMGNVEGWDFTWSIDETLVTPIGPSNIETLIVSPVIGFVERLCPRVDFGLLGLPPF